MELLTDGATFCVSLKSRAEIQITTFCPLGRIVTEAMTVRKAVRPNLDFAFEQPLHIAIWAKTYLSVLRMGAQTWCSIMSLRATRRVRQIKTGYLFSSGAPTTAMSAPSSSSSPRDNRSSLWATTTASAQPLFTDIRVYASI